MKKILFLASLLIVTMTSCTKNELDSPQNNEDRLITYATIVGQPTTKALITGTSYDESYSFGTAAFLHYDAFGNNGGEYIKESEVKCTENNTGWSTDEKYYLPLVGNLTFFSYHPYSSDMEKATTIDAASGITIENWDINAHQVDDIMIADRQTISSYEDFVQTNTAWEKGVKTLFRHKLAYVEGFNFRTNLETASTAETGTKVGETKVVLKKVEIKGIKSNGTYKTGTDVDADGKFTNDSWSDATTSVTSDYLWYNGEVAIGYSTSDYPTNVDVSTSSNETGQVKKDYLLVRPQNFSDHDTDYTLTEHLKITYVIQVWDGSKWITGTDKVVGATLYDIHTTQGYAMNKVITYNIEIDVRQNRIYWQPSVVDWDKDNATGKI